MLLSRRAVCWLLGGILPLLPAAPAAAQEVTLDVHHFLSAQAPAHKAFIEPWARRIEEQSNGRIAIDIYPAMSLGGRPSELYDQVVKGKVDIAWTVTGYTPARFPRTEVFELPFIHETDAVATNLAIQDLFDRHLAADYTETHPILVHVHAGQTIDMASQPIRRLEDLRGQRVRIPSRTGGWMVEAFGADSVGVPVTALPLAFDKNIIDGTMIPYEIVPPLRLQQRVNTVTVGHDDTRFGTAVFVLAMNQQVYDALPPDLQAVIDANSGANLAEAIGDVWMQVETRAESAIVGAGIERIELSAAETDRFREAAKPVVERWIEEVAALDIDGEALVRAARSAISQHQRR
jgi:TRAP-type C4-dicarboxylate transport system substrate-binding protein